jgi:hypothetical protein
MAGPSPAADLAPIITRLDPDGSLSLRPLAAKLTAESFPTLPVRLCGPRRRLRVKAKLAA